MRVNDVDKLTCEPNVLRFFLEFWMLIYKQIPKEFKPVASWHILSKTAQERQGPARADPEEGHEGGQRAEASLQWRQAEWRQAQPGEKKASRRPYSRLSVLKSADV